MSDDDRDIDIESDEDDMNLDPSGEDMRGNIYLNQVDKRAHHNALERKRRDHIKDSFSHLRDCIPLLKGEKASRAMILKKTADYIHNMEKKNTCVVREIDDLKKKNKVLEQEIQKLERHSIIPGNFASTLSDGNQVNLSDSDESDSEEKPSKKRKFIPQIN